MPRRSNNTIDFPDKAASGSGYNLTLPEDHPQSEQERRRRAWIHKHPIRITEVSCRWLEEPVRSTLEHFAALAARSLLILSGPRQAGQEELFGELMPSVATVDLDDPNSCSAAQDAPKTFLSRNAEKNRFTGAQRPSGSRFAQRLDSIGGAYGRASRLRRTQNRYCKHERRARAFKAPFRERMYSSFAHSYACSGRTDRHKSQFCRSTAAARLSLAAFP